MNKRTKVLDDPSEAAALLRGGGVVAFPTETVYGLGASALDSDAIASIFDAKERPSNNPLIVHVAAPDKWSLAAREITSGALALLAAFSPGPLTVVLPRQAAIADVVVAGLDTVGVRIPDHALAREFLALCNVPVAAPSANVSGRPSCTTWQSVLEDLDGRIDAILRGPEPTIGVESTVVDCTGEHPVLLRPGGISLEQLQRVVPGTTTMDSSGSTSELATKSPGLLHPHYQPSALVHLVEKGADGSQSIEALARKLPSGESFVYMGLDRPSDMDRWVASGLLACYVFATVDDYARHYYESLRSADRLGAQNIIVQLATGSNPLVTALRDRQIRSAAK